MADTRTASAPGRTILRVTAQPSPRPSAPVSEYARAYMLRLARRLAERSSARRALCRAELRARGPLGDCLEDADLLDAGSDGLIGLDDDPGALKSQPLITLEG